MPYQDAPAYDGPPVLTTDEERITLERILDIPGRENYLTILDLNVLFPIQKETKEKIPPEKNRTWFGKDKGVLTWRISRILKNQFDCLNTSWSKVPLDRQRRYFVEFAMKGMVSMVRR